MIELTQNPANGGALTGLQIVVCLAAINRAKDTSCAGYPQVSWARARYLEQRAALLRREALSLRGADRLNALAVALALGIGARDHALNAGGAQ